jgi:2-polyprenyl-3-methyl-5-hydroxy-6-metoxy-1,4-benzoquinol methylase
MTFRTVKSKPFSEITSEWDSLATTRYHQISSDIDITYNYLLRPTIIKLVKEYQPHTILDAGCGVGVLTADLSYFVKKVVGVDPSPRSINLAEEAAGSRNIEFHVDTIEALALKTDTIYDAVIANMVLMDTIDLESFLKSVFKLLSESGRFIFSITHPCFWPQYYGYASETWFDYQSELIIEGPFRTSLSGTGKLISTHVHRPLCSYISKLYASNFVIEKLYEPSPPLDILARYPETWKYPRYIVAVCQKKE